MILRVHQGCLVFEVNQLMAYTRASGYGFYTNWVITRLLLAGRDRVRIAGDELLTRCFTFRTTAKLVRYPLDGRFTALPRKSGDIRGIDAPGTGKSSHNVSCK